VNDTLPVGETPVTVAVHFVDAPSAITADAQDTEVTAAGGTLRTAKMDGSSATEAYSARPVETVRDGARLVIPKTASKNEIMPASTGEIVVLTASVTPPTPWSTEAVREDERDCVIPERP